MKNKVLITGTSRGLGLALTKEFLDNKYYVYTLNSSIRDELKILSEDYHNQLYNYFCDVTNEKDVLKSYNEISKSIESLDIIINNAGIYLEDRDGDLDDIDFDSMLQTYKVNSIAPLRIIKYFMPLLLKGDKKLLVNISSEAGSIGNAWRKSEFGYCMSKSALNMASKILQNRYESNGIKVFAIHPGWVKTDMGGKEAPIPPSESAKKIVQLILKKHDNNKIYLDLNGESLPW